MLSCARSTAEPEYYVHQPLGRRGFGAENGPCTYTPCVQLGEGEGKTGLGREGTPSLPVGPVPRMLSEVITRPQSIEGKSGFIAGVRRHT